jgi:hypothetical protein
MIPPAGQLNMMVGSGARVEFLNQADPAVRAMITDQLKLQGLRDVQITDGVIRDEIARRNAATMLGLPAENTAAGRAAAMGFDTPVYHGAKNANQTSFIASRGGELGPGLYVTKDAEVASGYARSYQGGSGVYPVLTKSLDEMPRNEWLSRRGSKFDQLQEENGGEWSADFYDKGNDLMRYDAETNGMVGYYTPGIGGENQGVIFDPKNIRSRFAAFDPARAKESDILAGIAGLSLIPALTLQDYFRQGQ